MTDNNKNINILKSKNLTFLKKQLRVLFLKSDSREAVFRKFRIEKDKKVSFLCARCGHSYRKKSMEVDHKESLAKRVSERTRQNMTVSKYLSIYVRELFNERNLQLLCISCHAQKTWEDK